MEFIKTFLANQKARTQQNKAIEISETFNIAVKDDKLWITHDGYAIKEIEGTATADDIVATLNNFKETAIRYK